MLPETSGFVARGIPVPGPRLLEQQERILKDPVIAQLEMGFVFDHRQIGHASQGGEEMFFGIWVVHSPHRLENPVRASVAVGPELDACHVEFAAFVTDCLEVAIPGLAGPDSRQKADNRTDNRCFAHCPPAPSQPSVHVHAVPSIADVIMGLGSCKRAHRPPCSIACLSESSRPPALENSRSGKCLYSSMPA